jgi:hypothetical protein
MRDSGIQLERNQECDTRLSFDARQPPIRSFFDFSPHHLKTLCTHENPRRRCPVEIVRQSILPKYQQQNRLLVTVVTMVFRTALTSAARRMTLAAASQVSLDDVCY